MRRWRLTSNDLASLDRWEDYTQAEEEMFLATDVDHAPWITVRSNDKKRARLNAMRVLLDQFDYQDQDPALVLVLVYSPDPLIVARGREALGD